MNKGYLIVDGAKNVLLVHPDEFDLMSDLLDRIRRKRGERIGDMVKKHKKMSDLDKTIHSYLKCEFDDERIGDES